MFHQFTDPKLNAIFKLTDNVGLISDDASIKKGLIHIIWNRSDEKASFFIDNIPVDLEPQQITTSTYLQTVRFSNPLPELTIWSFNREFYCINDHDHEVSCNGIIFFGTQETPILSLDAIEEPKMDTLLKVFVDEFGTEDNIQGEMLQMLLKRLIIKCTRLAKEQLITKQVDINQLDIIRKFNVLVDTNYKTKKQVGEYADLLNKSPKTLANLFSIYNDKTPLRIIHERIVLEGKRQLLFTDNTSKEIAYNLGFDDVSPFNKMFKKITGFSPTAFKNSQKVLN